MDHLILCSLVCSHAFFTMLAWLVRSATLIRSLTPFPEREGQSNISSNFLDFLNHCASYSESAPSCLTLKEFYTNLFEDGALKIARESNQKN